MALDHYIPQVHLRKFNSPLLGGRMYALRKTDLKSFQPASKDVCRIENGSTNAYLLHDRVIEGFLKTIEPKYDAAIQNLTADAVDAETVYTIAGFTAYVMLCSPAGMRIGTELPKKTAEISARALDAMGEIPPPPEALGGKSLRELLTAGKVKITVDPKYPQAIGITNVLDTTKMFGNFAWDIVHNAIDDSPFVTSDFPVAIERSDDVRVLNRLVSLSPRLAVRICPDISVRREECDFSFAKFSYRVRTASRKEVSYLNTAFVRCAEETVFYRDALPWVQPFIAKNRHYRIEPHVHELPHGTGTMLIATQRVVETTR